MVTYEMIFQARTTLHNLILVKWLEEDVFSPRWWSIVVLVALSYLLCFSLFDKRRLSKLFLFGSLLTVGVVVYETVGVNFVFWVCATPIFPIIPCLFVPYLTILPVYYMLIFQYTTTWRQFSLWNLVAVSVYSLVLLPIFIHFKIVILDNWQEVYHMPMLFAIASLARAVTLLLENIEQRQEMKARNFSSTAMFSQPVMKPVDAEKKREDEP
ncbi:MAG: hypothetical protein H7Y07_10560 [Pyrinomonadaceae bacterium]|nr:hypothetical protein [Sphingobacteriaceae bacterium]